MALNWPQKSPGERLDYTINWAPPLGTDTIVSSTWTINGSGLTTDNNTFGPNTATIWLLGGTVSQQYAITNTITTAGTRVYVQQVNINIVAST